MRQCTYGSLVEREQNRIGNPKMVTRVRSDEKVCVKSRSEL